MNEKILQAMRNGDVEWLRQHLGHMGARFTFFKEEKSSVPTYFHAAWNSPDPNVLLGFLNKSKSSKDSRYFSGSENNNKDFLLAFRRWVTFSPQGLRISSISETLLEADYNDSDVRKKATAFIQFMSRNGKDFFISPRHQSHIDFYVNLFKGILRKLLLEGTHKQIKQTLMADMPYFLNLVNPTSADLSKTLTIREAVKSKARLINLSLLVNLIYQDALSQLGEDFVKHWDQNYEAIVDLLEKHEVVSVIDGVDGVWLFDGKTSFPAKYIIPILRKLESVAKPAVWHFSLYMAALRFAKQKEFDTVYRISQVSDDFFLLGYLNRFERGFFPNDEFSNDLVKKFYKDYLYKHKLSKVVEAIFKSKAPLKEADAEEAAVEKAAVKEEAVKEAVEFLEQHGVMLRQDIQNAGINISEYIEKLKGTQRDKDNLLRFFQQVPAAAPEVVEEGALPTYEEVVSQGIPPELAKEVELRRAIEKAPPKYSKFDTEEKPQEWDLEEENAVLKEELAAAHQQIHSLEEQLKGEGERVRLLEKELAASQQAQAARMGLSTHAEKRVVTANAEIAQLRQEKVVSEAELARVESEYEAQAKTISDLEQKNAAAEEKIEAMQGLASRSESAEQHAAKLEGVVAEQQKTIAKLERKHADEMRAMQREMARLKAQLAKSQQSAVQKAPAAKPASVHSDSPLLRSQFPVVPTREPGEEKEPAKKSRAARRRAARKGQAQLDPHG